MSQLVTKFIADGAITNAKVNASAAIAYSKLSLTGSIVNADINASAAIAYSKLSLSNSIVNADINSAAAIAYSKLSLTGSIVNADINASAAIVYSKLSLSNSIVNADINSAAAIAYSKLSLSNSIVNADISSSAAIAYSKLNLATSVKASDINSQAATSGQVLTADGAGGASFATITAGSTANKETFVLSGTDITNQYIDLAQVAKTGSILFMVKGAGALLEGASYDYSVSYTGGAGGKTRITFLNDLATGGSAALVATDVVQVNYQY